MALTTHRHSLWHFIFMIGIFCYSALTQAAIIAGNSHGSITLVEFVDFACPHCRQTMKNTEFLLQHHQQLRVVYKIVPALGSQAQSIDAWVLASQYQGKFASFQRHLLQQQGMTNRNDLLRIAKESGLNITKLVRDVNNPAIALELQQNFAELQTLHAHRVPLLLIGYTKALKPQFYITGEFSYRGMKNLIEQLKKHSHEF